VTDVVERTPASTDDRVAALTHQIEHLERALVSRDVIGQAKGILMERYRITADEAFEKLRTASQRQNRKLAVLAEELATTGQCLPDLPA